MGTVTGKLEGYTVERKRLGFVVVGTGSRPWASLYASPIKCGIPTLQWDGLFLPWRTPKDFV